MSHFFPQKDDAPSREPLSADEILWQGKPSLRPQYGKLAVCFALFWLAVPLYLAWRIVRLNQTTHYIITRRYIQIRNDQFESANRILEIYRVGSVEVEDESAGLKTVIVKAKDDYTPPVVYRGVEFSDDDLKRVQSAVDATNEKKRISEIQIPVLG